MKVKCIHIITKLELGGAQDNTLYTLEALEHDRYEKILITGEGGILDLEAKKSNKYETYFLKNLVRKISPINDLIAFTKLYALIKKLKPDIVHTHSSKAGILGRWAAYFSGVPIIIHTYHGFGFNKYQNMFYRNILIFVEKLSSKITTHLITVAEDNVRTLIKFNIAKKEKVTAIHSGIRRLKQHYTKSDVQNLIPLYKNERIVANVSCLKPQKNPVDFVMLAKIIKYDYHFEDVKFILIGDGELRTEVENAVKRYELGDSCLLIGWRRDAQKIVQQSDIFVLTSLWEGLPRALVEAMYMEKPSVVYDVDGTRDIIKSGNNGFLIPVKNINLMAEKVSFLLKSSEERIRLGKEAKSTLNESFFIENMVTAIDRIYSALIESKRSGQHKYC
ncbi:MAG: glycosyltransferase family 4 protein [bacterium]